MTSDDDPAASDRPYLPPAEPTPPAPPPPPDPATSPDTPVDTSPVDTSPVDTSTAETPTETPTVPTLPGPRPAWPPTPPTLPTTGPGAPPATPTLPSSGPGAPPDRPARELSGASAAEALPADAVATRNVPQANTTDTNYGLPSAPPEAAPKPFERPDLVAMGEPVTALLVGRAMFVIAALLVGIAARRATGGDADVFWPVVWSAGVFTLVGVAGTVYWAASLADNARRLAARTVTARGMVWTWLLPVGWIVLSCLTYLRIDVDAEFDPLPAVAAFGWLIALALAYGRLQGVFRGLMRTPPILWVSVFPVDLVALGLLWWRLTGWPSPVGTDLDGARLTADVAFWVAAALAVNLLLFVWLAQQGSNGVFQRLGRLEAQHRPHGNEPTPEWFQAGLAGRSGTEPHAARRPLVSTRHLATAVSALHVLWGLASVAFGVVLAQLAFEYGELPVFIADELVIADSDRARVELVGAVVGLAYFGAVVTHGVWAVLSATNGRRVTVHSPNPGTFVIAFSPMPLLVGAGAVVGGRVGYWLALAGFTVGFLALVLVNQMLMALSARLGGRLDGFARWSACIALTYLAGVVLNLLFSASQSQLGFYASLALIQGVLIAAGGVIGFGAMRGLERTLVEFRQARRVHT